MEKPALNSMSCNNCGKKLAELKIEKGVVSIKCSKCGVLNVQETKPVQNGKTIGH